MCLICIEFQKERMSLADARRALGEMVDTIDPQHAQEVREMLRQAQAAAAKPDDGRDP